MGEDELGVDEMGVGEMGSRRSGNKPIQPGYSIQHWQFLEVILFVCLKVVCFVVAMSDLAHHVAAIFPLPCMYLLKASGNRF